MTTGLETVMLDLQPVPFKLFSHQHKHFAKGNYKHEVYKIWHRCYLDKRDFNQEKLLLSQSDIFNICENRKITVIPGLYIMPILPNQPLSSQNALIVDKEKRKFLLALWRLTKDENLYTCCAEDVGLAFSG